MLNRAVVTGCLMVAALLAGSRQASADTPNPAAAAKPPGPIAWTTCPDQPEAQCGTFLAPLDYDEPNGPQIKVAIIRRQATDPAHRIGSMFYSAGGPGGPTNASLVDFYPLISPRVRERFDIVGIDPRGIADTEQLHCFNNQKEEDDFLAQFPPGGFPINSQEEERQIELQAEFNRRCVAQGGPIQYHSGTADVARDMDRAREALGDPLMYYYGPSYGSYLGVVYANLFPTKVGRIVLDGNVPPVEWNDARGGKILNTFLRLSIPAGAVDTLLVMLRQCGAVDTARCAFSAGTPQATVSKYRTLLARLRARPVTVNKTSFTYALTVTTVVHYLQSQNASPASPGWKSLGELLQALYVATESGGAAQPLSADVQRMVDRVGSTRHRPMLSGGFNAGLAEGVYTVLCGESPNPRDPYSYQVQSAWANAGNPYGFGSQWTWAAEGCAQWKPRNADIYTGPWNRSTKPYLLIGTLYDPNTPYAATLRMAAELPNARVLTETGGGHTALLNKSDCIDNYVADYLISGTLPPVNTRCDQNQQPF